MKEPHSGRPNARLPTVGRWVARATWQPDKWERLSLVAEHVGADAANVLDVGGRGHEMARLLPSARVMSANVRSPADTIVPPDGLPFDDDAFDVVTSCDVIEHMEADRRAGHMAELLRVARRRLVLCCPWGSTERVEEELRLWDRLESELGIRADFLDEHIEYGLPTEHDLRGWILAAAPEASVLTRYQPAFEGGEDLVVDGLRARHRRDPAALLRYLRRGYLTRRRPELLSTPSPDSHRLFLIVELTP